MSADRVVRNVSVSTFVYVLGSLASLIVIPILLNTLGPTQFGVYVLAQTTMSFSSLANGGINRGFMRSIVARETTEGPEGARAVIGTGLSLMLASAAAISLLLLVVYPLLVRVYHLPEDLQTDFAWIMGGVLVAYVCALVTTPYQALLVARGRLDLVKSTEAGLIIAHSLLSAGVVLAGFGLRGLAYATAGVALPAAVASYLLARRVGHTEASARPSLNRAIVTELWHFGSRIQVVTLAGLVNRSVDRLTIGVFRTTSDVASYDVADRAAYSMVYTANTMAEALMPSMAGHLARDDVDSARETYRRSTAVFSLAATTIGAFAVFQSPHILFAWLGRAEPVVVATLAVLALGYATAVSLSATSIVANTQAKPTLAMRFSVAQASVNVALSVAGVLAAGIVGAAAGSAIAGGLGTLVYSQLVERRILGASGWVGARTLARTALLTVPVGLVMGALMWWLVPATGAGRAAVLALLVAVFFVQGSISVAAAVRLGLVPADETRALAARITSRFRRGAKDGRVDGGES